MTATKTATKTATADLVKVKFTATREVQDENAGTEAAQVFEKGKRYALPRASADRWIRRGVAVEAK